MARQTDKISTIALMKQTLTVRVNNDKSCFQFFGQDQLTLITLKTSVQVSPKKTNCKMFLARMRHDAANHFAIAKRSQQKPHAF